MDLIYYQGLNCHLACIINIANSLGVNYLDSFATLWSETDFTDEVKYKIYVSKRIFVNLEAIGVMIEALDCDEGKAEKSVSQLSDGELFFVGSDTFDIPWHPVFNNFHDYHYFFAQKETAHSALCFDPVYNKKNIRISLNDIISPAFEISRIHKIDASPTKNGLLQEAKAVLRYHPETEKELLTEILKCNGEGKKSIDILLKQMIAMINNRYLFRHFLHNSELICGRHDSFFNAAYFLKWEAVRNGLYKALIIKDNKNVIDEVHGLFSGLMRDEISMAQEIINIADF